MKVRFIGVFFFLMYWSIALNTLIAQDILDHKVVLDEHGKLQPWTTYDNIFEWSMNFIKYCPTSRTIYGDDPLFLITSSLDPNGRSGRNQNNQGSNVYWAVETLRKYYAYTGDSEAYAPIKLLLDRVLYYHTPDDWTWANVPRTQDNSPDGEYTDEWSGVDKICMVALGYINYFKLTGETKFSDAAITIANTVIKHVKTGDKMISPLPYRVNLRTGQILDPYTSNMIFAVRLFDEMIEGNYPVNKKIFKEKRDLIWNWILKFPIQNNEWSGYYEDVPKDYERVNQQNPMETARYMMQNSDVVSDYKTYVPALLDWVENLFGQTTHWGARSIREQIGCYLEMGSHTARYASIAAMWFGKTNDLEYREEARASFAISIYSAFTNYSWDKVGVNRTGIGYERPWFSDSYFDYLSHIFDGLAELPEMVPEGTNHITYSSSVITDVTYSPEKIEYSAFDSNGEEILKLNFEPKVYVDNRLLEKSNWKFGEYRGAKNILRITRENSNHIVIKE